jgi:hypothetical protein
MTEGRRERTFTNLFDPAPVMAQLRGLTDREAAERIGADRQMVNFWRNGRRRMTEETADRAACALGLHPTLLWPEWGTTKHCPKCGQNHHYSRFHSNRSKWDGLASWCKGCTATTERLRYHTAKAA